MQYTAIRSIHCIVTLPDCKTVFNFFGAQERGIRTASLIVGHVTVTHGNMQLKPGCACVTLCLYKSQFALKHKQVYRLIGRGLYYILILRIS